jgi:hypothetical protein
MAYVEVEVDLDMFSTDDILIELEYRKDEMTSKMMERLNRLNNNYSSGNKLYACISSSNVLRLPINLVINNSGFLFVFSEQPIQGCITSPELPLPNTLYSII